MGPPPHADIVVKIHYPQCLDEGIHFYQDPQSAAFFTHGVTARGILPPKYFWYAVECATGVQVYPDFEV